MKLILAGLIFLTYLPISSANLTDFSSVTESCSQSAEGSHNVQENAYQRLLASLMGEGQETRRPEKKQQETEGSGQR